MAAPPWPLSMVSSILRLLKKPLSLPRKIGATSTIGMTPTLTWSTASLSPDGSDPPDDPHAATTPRSAAARTLAKNRRMSCPSSCVRSANARSPEELMICGG
jgi:hypothetical protein